MVTVSEFLDKVDWTKMFVRDGAIRDGDYCPLEQVYGSVGEGVRQLGPTAAIVMSAADKRYFGMTLKNGMKAQLLRLRMRFRMLFA